ncbi:hypothetical protein ACWF82_22815 [Nocardia sp. NPDC055053]
MIGLEEVIAMTSSTFRTDAVFVEETVPVTRTTEQGDRIEVWLDGAGTSTGASRAPAAAVVSGIGVAVVVLGGAGLSMGGLVVTTDLIVGYRPSMQWDREWLAMRRPARGES